MAAPDGTVSSTVIPTLDELLTADPDQFVAKHTDIGAVNLACARGLPNCDDSEFSKYLALLDTIADAVRKHTERSWRLFNLKPAQFNRSENVFRLYTMEHVFRVQFGIRYDPIVRVATKSPGSWRPADSSEVFIHGILSDKRTGTCASLPTFAIAVGRRLGYPLKLVLVPNHTLYRWDDGKGVFNLQPTEAGGEVKPDEYFHTWPRVWDQTDHQLNARTKVWLNSLTPRREVSKFLCNRALMLRDTKRHPEALEAIRAAERFDPINPACADTYHSVEYAMAGGDVSSLLSGNGPLFTGRLGVGSVLPPMSSFDVPPVQPKRPPQQSRGQLDFAMEHARLVQLINESNRNRSPQYPNGNPPTEPLMRQLAELLFKQHNNQRGSVNNVDARLRTD